MKNLQEMSNEKKAKLLEEIMFIEMDGFNENNADSQVEKIENLIERYDLEIEHTNKILNYGWYWDYMEKIKDTLQS